MSVMQVSSFICSLKAAPLLDIVRNYEIRNVSFYCRLLPEISHLPLSGNTSSHRFE